jgi:hypothetical protein
MRVSWLLNMKTRNIVNAMRRNWRQTAPVHQHILGDGYTRIAKSNGATFLSSALQLSLALRFISIQKMGDVERFQVNVKIDHMATSPGR